ncbi:LysE family transporter [Modicisalibacter coralii]|uniref:LysE family transporter n=1 Tax=Modicisalibacter coralii TaxID=2304602 RepID=UPI00100ADB18|nr:LysE family transporter [Halomonas coralii]
MLADVINWALVMALPGPDILAIATCAIKYGRSAGFRAAAGVTLGVATWSLLSMIGIAAILKAVPVLREILPIIGALVLVGLGFLNLLKNIPLAKHSNDKSDGSRVYAHGIPNAFGYGLLTNVSNPKALVFFTAIFTPMMASYSGVVDKLLVFLILISVSFLVFGVMAVMFSLFSLNRFFHNNVFGVIPGVVFVFIGLYYLVDIL